MPISLTYIAIAALTALGIDNADQVLEAVITIIAAGVALYGRYRVGGINILGLRLK